MGRKHKNLWEYRTVHHLIPKSQWWLTVKYNTIIIKNNYHRALHLLFWNIMPHEQILVLLELNWKTMNEEVIKNIKEILSNVDNIYKPWLYHKH